MSVTSKAEKKCHKLIWVTDLQLDLKSEDSQYEKAICGCIIYSATPFLQFAY